MNSLPVLLLTPGGHTVKASRSTQGTGYTQRNHWFKGTVLTCVPSIIKSVVDEGQLICDRVVCVCVCGGGGGGLGAPQHPSPPGSICSLGLCIRAAEMSTSTNVNKDHDGNCETYMWLVIFKKNEYVYI